MNAAEVIERALAESGLYMAADGTAGLDTIRGCRGDRDVAVRPVRRPGAGRRGATWIPRSSTDHSRAAGSTGHENAMLRLVPADSFVVATQEGVTRA